MNEQKQVIKLNEHKDNCIGDSTNKDAADELYRIHAYTKTLATLCSTGASQNIDPEHLEQIFNDIAAVTDVAAARLYKIKA